MDVTIINGINKVLLIILLNNNNIITIIIIPDHIVITILSFMSTRGPTSLSLAVLQVRRINSFYRPLV